MQAEKRVVQAWWEEHPCEAEDWAERGLTREYFDRIAAHRYQTHPYIVPFAEFDSWRGARVLEIGVGLGTDFCRWAAQSHAFGVDLTVQGAGLTRANLALHDLKGSLYRGDAEQLPFRDESFDLVYSFGVLHHTPDVAAAVREIHRVLRTAGEIRIMLYHIWSWVTFRTWLYYSLARGRLWCSPRSVLAEHMESPGTKAYTLDEVRALFRDFRDVDVRVMLTTYDRWDESRRAGIVGVAHRFWPRWLVTVLGNSLGWNLLISGKK